MSDHPRLTALAARLGLGAPGPTLERLARLYAALDAELAERARGLDLPCRAGCDACCHESVFVSAPEYLAIVAELLQTRGAAELEALVRAMGALAERFEDELELLETISPGPERDEVAARVKFRCPLLSPEGACTVYPARELNARTFGQSWDERSSAPYGCTDTHARLVVLGGLTLGAGLLGARAARARLADLHLGDEGGAPATVHVLPWWFTRYAP